MLSYKSNSLDPIRVRIGNQLIGEGTNNTLLIAGPCAVESVDQMRQVCEYLVKNNVHVLRAGCFKPRTSPYTFQGLEERGLDILQQMRQEFGLLIATEVRDASHLDAVIELADIVQIGTKAMYDHAILTRCGEIKKPVILKRGFGSTLQEFALAADFILSRGNDQVILCERGIRSFETATRFTLDLCGVAWMREHLRLPIIVDPSHAMGYAYGVPSLACAAMAMGVDGLLIETHPTPNDALSDAAQQLDEAQFSALCDQLPAIAAAVGREVI